MTSSACRWSESHHHTSSEHAIPMGIPMRMSSEGRTVETPYNQYHPGTGSTAAR